MRKNNPEHVKMFTFIPKESHIIAKPEARTRLPAFLQLTGNNDIDILVWVRTALQNEDVTPYLNEVEAKLDEMSMEPAKAILNFVDNLRKSGSQNFDFMRDVFNLNANWKGEIERLRRRYEEAESIINKFGSREAVFELTLPEKIIVENYGYLYEVCDEESEFRESVVSGFRHVLPSPTTLTDVIREWEYWAFISNSRLRVKDPKSYLNKTPWKWDRIDFLIEQLTCLKPVTRTEALTVCKWLLACDYFEGRDSLFDRIILNLVGECEE
ncbi:hypothetical protein ACN94K_002537 [Klebsiella quasipneumoniae]|uniref:hypothetical protein n=1 Tax=Klebsiella sp. GG_Kp162 TaxID=3153473 RepID=UPI0032B455CB